MHRFSRQLDEASFQKLAMKLFGMPRVGQRGEFLSFSGPVADCLIGARRFRPSGLTALQSQDSCIMLLHIVAFVDSGYVAMILLSSAQFVAYSKCPSSSLRPI